MDPVSQVLAQQSSGSAEGQGFGNFFLQGQQHAIEQRRTAIQEAENVREQGRYDAVKPYLAQNAYYQNVINGQNVQFNSNKLANEAQLNNALPAIAELEHAFMTSPDGFTDKALQQKWYEMAQKYPKAFVPEGSPGNSIFRQMQAMPMIDAMMNKLQGLQQKLDQSGSPYFIKGIDPKTGAPEFAPNPRIESPLSKAQFNRDAAMRRGDSQAAMEAQQEIDNITGKLTAAQRDAKAMSDLQRQIQLETDPTKKQDLQNELNNLKTVTEKPTFYVKTNADGSSEIIQGPQSQITATQTGKLKEQLAYGVDTVKRIEDLKGSVGNIFGPGAATGEIIVDKVLSNFAPQLLNKQRVRGREAASYVKEGIIRSLNKGQGTLSDADVKRLSNVYPALKHIDEIFESPVHAKEVLTELQQQIARDAYLQNNIAGQPQLDAEALSFLDPFFLDHEFRAGKIDSKTFSSALSNSPYTDQVNELAASLRKDKRGR